MIRLRHQSDTNSEFALNFESLPGWSAVQRQFPCRNKYGGGFNYHLLFSSLIFFSQTHTEIRFQQFLFSLTLWAVRGGEQCLNTTEWKKASNELKQRGRKKCLPVPFHLYKPSLKNLLQLSGLRIPESMVTKACVRKMEQPIVVFTQLTNVLRLGKSHPCWCTPVGLSFGVGPFIYWSMEF